MPVTPVPVPQPEAAPPPPTAPSPPPAPGSITPPAIALDPSEPEPSAPLLMFPIATAYVFVMLFVAPTVMKAKKKKKYPMHKLYFVFEVLALILGTYNFINPFLVAQSQSVPMRLAYKYLPVQVSAVVCYAFCYLMLFLFMNEAFRILALEDDTERNVEMLFHLLIGQVKPWISMASPEGKLWPVFLLMNVGDLAISSYFSFQPYLEKHIKKNMKMDKKQVLQLIMLYVLVEYAVVSARVAQLIALSQRPYGVLFKAYIVSYLCLSVLILLTIMSKFPKKTDTDPDIERATGIKGAKAYRDRIERATKKGVESAKKAISKKK